MAFLLRDSVLMVGQIGPHQCAGQQHLLGSPFAVLGNPRQVRQHIVPVCRVPIQRERTQPDQETPTRKSRQRDPFFSQNQKRREINAVEFQKRRQREAEARRGALFFFALYEINKCGEQCQRDAIDLSAFQQGQDRMKQADAYPGDYHCVAAHPRPQ